MPAKKPRPKVKAPAAPKTTPTPRRKSSKPTQPGGKTLEGRSALLALASELTQSPTLLPNDHAKMLIELLRPTGVELARRWLAALQLVPVDERERVVSAIEQRILEQFAGSSAHTEFGPANSPQDSDASLEGKPAGEVRVVFPAVQREGFVEQVIKTYGPADDQSPTTQATSSNIDNKPGPRRRGTA